MHEALGFEVTALGDELARGRFEITDALRQPMGVVHGGAYAAMAETLASAVTDLAVQSEGNVAVGQSNHTSFLRPAVEGFVHAEARCRHRGRTSWVWEIDFTDDAGKLCAISRVTMAVPSPAASWSARGSSGSGGGASKMASTRAASVPSRTMSLLARAPSASATASTTSDFPAPVSPVSTVKPGDSSTRTDSTTARLWTVSSRSAIGRQYGSSEALVRSRS